MAVAAELFHLEQLDTALDGCETALLDLRRRTQRNPELERAETEASALAARERAVAAEQRALEAELADVEARIKRDDARMYGGQIVDPRELASLQRELAHHSTQRDALEEQLLQAMESFEEVQQGAAAAARRAEELRRQWEADRPGLDEERHRLSAEIARLRAERETLTATLDTRALQLYTRLHAASGHAISNVTSGVCQWCRVTIPPKDVQHARSGALVTCSNCARILHVGG